jgi:hypothetical protein
MWSEVGHPGKYSFAPEPEGFYFPTMFVHRQAGRQDTRNQFYSLQRIQKCAICYGWLRSLTVTTLGYT